MIAKACLIVFRKELTDALRDRRSLVSAFMFCWLGPLLLAALWRQPTVLALLPGFLIVSAFTGAMNIANDTMAGERERGSLEALLINPIEVRDLVLGKGLAACAFSLLCMLLTLLGTVAVLAATPLGGRMHAGALVWMLAAALPLAPMAAGIELLICTFARTPKEGTSYLSVTLLAPMLTGMLAEFYPLRLDAAVAALPLLGQQRMLSAITRGAVPQPEWLLLSGFCAVLIGTAALFATVRLLRNEKVVFGWRCGLVMGVGDTAIASLAIIDRRTLTDQHERIFAAYGPALARMTACFEARPDAREDLLQEIMLAIWKALPGFRGDCSEKTFAFRVAHNRCLTHVWRRGQAPVREARIPDIPDRRKSPEALAVDGRRRETLVRAIRSLPVNYRQVIGLALEDLAPAEIAAVLASAKTTWRCD